MSCQNCYNGCAEITSDQCIKYTGIDVPALGIHNGDSLLSVENAIVNFLVPVLNGEGINPTIPLTDICALVASNLSICAGCTSFTLNDILTAIIKSVCSLQTQINNVVSDLATLEGNYSIGCLTGVTADAGTHNILQATINKLCLLNSAVASLTITISTSYVKSADLTSLIQAYLDSIGTTTLVSEKMIPYTILPFYGSEVGKFDGTGAGIGDWINIYLCNGQNSTPDLRGRVMVGATTMGNVNWPSQTNPLVSGNPVYSLGSAINGANQVALTSAAQIPSHSHSASAVDSGHYHLVAGDGTGTPLYDVAGAAINWQHNYGNTSSYQFYGASGAANVGASSVNTANISVTVNNSGQTPSMPHSNVQPGMGMNFIIYIPA